MPQDLKVLEVARNDNTAAAGNAPGPTQAQAAPPPTPRSVASDQVARHRLGLPPLTPSQIPQANDIIADLMKQINELDNDFRVEMYRSLEEIAHNPAKFQSELARITEEINSETAAAAAAASAYSLTGADSQDNSPAEDANQESGRNSIDSLIARYYYREEEMALLDSSLQYHQQQEAQGLLAAQEGPPQLGPLENIDNHKPGAAFSADMEALFPDTSKLSPEEKAATIARADAERARYLESTAPILTFKVQAIADHLMEKFGTFLKVKDGGENGDRQSLQVLCGVRAKELHARGYDTPLKAQQLIEGMLKRDAMLRMLSGALGSIGYGSGVVAAFQGLVPALQRTSLPPFLQGVLAGFLITAPDKGIASGFLAVINPMLYNAAKTIELPALLESLPPKWRTVIVSAVLAGVLTTTKNIAFRLLVGQITVPDRKRHLWVDSMLDWTGAAVFAALGKKLNHALLLKPTEGMNLLAQPDFLKKVETHTTTTPARSVTDTLKNVYSDAASKSVKFAKGSTNAALLPSNYLNAMWWGAMVGLLVYSFDKIDKRHEIPGQSNHMGHLQALERNLDVSALTGVLMFVTTLLAQLGPLDHLLASVRARVTSLGHKNPQTKAEEIEMHRIEDVTDEPDDVQVH
ncbi:MAG: hypothetical protein ACRYGK_15400 [Janthinobacterium lividum]